MKKHFLFLSVVAFLLNSCSNVTTGFEMIGEFKDGKYINDFSVDSRYWPSFVMVIPEKTNLDEKQLEAVAIFNDYGVMNEQNPVGYNISHFTQNGINTKRTTLFEIEDREDLYLYLDDANAESIAFSTYDETMDAYDFYIQSINGDDPKKVASGDADKLNSYSTVVGTDIYWTELIGDDVEIVKDGLNGSREVVQSYTNAYGFLIESHGPYYVYYMEEYDEEDYSLLNNEVVVVDASSNSAITHIQLDDDYEITTGVYDGEYVFFTAYDYGTGNYFYGRLHENGHIDKYTESEDNDFTFTGVGDRVMDLSAYSGAKSDYYKAHLSNILTLDTDATYEDLLNAGFYNNYLFYVACDLNSAYLIDNISLHIEDGRE